MIEDVATDDHPNAEIRGSVTRWIGRDTTTKKLMYGHGNPIRMSPTTIEKCMGLWRYYRENTEAQKYFQSRMRNVVTNETIPLDVIG